MVKLNIAYKIYIEKWQSDIHISYVHRLCVYASTKKIKNLKISKFKTTEDRAQVRNNIYLCCTHEKGSLVTMATAQMDK